MVKDIFIVGAGGLAQEVLWLINCINNVHMEYNVIGFVSEIKEQWGTKFHGYSVVNPNSVNMSYAAFGFSDPLGKKKFAAKHKMTEFPNLIHPDVMFAAGAGIDGVGVVLFPKTVFMPYSKIKSFAYVNVSCVIGHDTVIGEYCSVAPGAMIAGNNVIGECTSIGIGACTREKINIGSRCVIGAGASVVHDIPDKSMAVGVPAKVIKALK